MRSACQLLFYIHAYTELNNDSEAPTIGLSVGIPGCVLIIGIHVMGLS